MNFFYSAPSVLQVQVSEADCSEQMQLWTAALLPPSQAVTNGVVSPALFTPDDVDVLALLLQQAVQRVSQNILQRLSPQGVAPWSFNADTRQFTFPFLLSAAAQLRAAGHELELTDKLVNVLSLDVLCHWCGLHQSLQPVLSDFRIDFQTSCLELNRVLFYLRG